MGKRLDPPEGSSGGLLREAGGKAEHKGKKTRKRSLERILAQRLAASLAPPRSLFFLVFFLPPYLTLSTWGQRTEGKTCRAGIRPQIWFFCCSLCDSPPPSFSFGTQETNGCLNHFQSLCTGSASHCLRWFIPHYYELLKNIKLLFHALILRYQKITFSHPPLQGLCVCMCYV